MLGGESDAPEPPRRLSPTELAAVEFLWLSLIRELHQATSAPVWRLDGVSCEPPAQSPPRDRERQDDSPQTDDGIDEQSNARAVVATFALRFGSLHGLVNFYFTRDALGALEGLRYSSLFAEGERGAQLKTYTSVAPDVRLRPVLGETDVTASDIAHLEPGDVVVVARPHARLEGGRLSGRLEVSLGDGAAAVLSGRIETTGDEATQLLIERIGRGGELHGTERGSMEQEQTGDDSNESAIALEEILLTVRVELAHRRLSLDELARLRVGQLLPLDCQPTDPVDLVADGRRIARGELVEIEGRLGVRITQVTGR
jgi:type III secretion protein Q